MAKRGQGEGSITEIKKPGKPLLYQARVTTGYDNNGKQKRQAKYFKTKNEAKIWLREIKSAQDKGVYIEPSKMTVSEWLDIWLNEYKRRQVRASTYGNLYNDINVHIKPELGKIKLKDLRSEMVQKFINTLDDKGLAKGTISKIVSCLHGSLEQAVENELILKNVAIKTVLPRKDKQGVRVLTIEEQARLIAVARRKPNGEMFILMLATGLRIGEVTALTWDDIDFDSGTVSVNKTISRGFDEKTKYKSNRIVSDPKTKTSNRIVPLLPSILEILKNKKQSDIPNKYNLLYTSKNGELLSHTTVHTRLHKILYEANIDKKGIHVHSLRHSFATRGMENGIDIKVMQELLGHASIKMTADIYTHVLPNKKKESIMKLANTISI